MLSPTSRILAFLFCIVLLSRPSAAAGTYTNFYVQGHNSFPTGVNKWGSVTGDNTPTAGGFVYQAGTGKITTFGLPGNTVNYATSINAAGSIAGYYYGGVVGATPYHGFLRNPKYTILDAPGAGTDSFQGTQALSINDGGQISGVYFDSNSVEHGFVRDASGNYTIFDVAGGTGVLSAYLNQSGQVAGTYTDTISSHGYARDALGNITPFDVTGSTNTFVASINASGQTAGYYTVAGVATPLQFVRDAAGNVTTFAITGFYRVAGITDAGDVYGAYMNSTGTGFGWKRTSAGVISFFKDPSAGGLGTFPTCVSGNGKVAGYYWAGGQVYNFVMH